jgi:membrane protein
MRSNEPAIEPSAMAPPRAVTLRGMSRLCEASRVPVLEHVQESRLRLDPEAVIARAPGNARRVVELCVRTVLDTLHDRVPGLAAEIAFFLLLSLPPLLLLLLGSVGYIGAAAPGFAEQAPDRLLGLAGTILTEDTIATARPVVEDLLAEGRADLASLGVLLTIYSASRALRAVVIALSIAYDLEDHRPRWKQRLWALGLTMIGLVVGVAALPLLVLGPGFGAVLGDHFGLNPVLDVAWRISYWPAAAVIATVLVASLYHFAAPWATPWRRDLPGAVLAMVVWLGGSAGLRYYVRGSAVSDEVLAPLAGPLVLLLWLYVSALAVLLGAELNAEIEKLWPSLLPGEPPRGADETAPPGDQPAG